MYNRDITYGTNAEMGFDYLRDNGMAQSAEEQVQRGHYFAIVDEVDSILIDEARTPLIISGPAQVKQDQQLHSNSNHAFRIWFDNKEAVRQMYSEASGSSRNWAILKMQRSSRSVAALPGTARPAQAFWITGGQGGSANRRRSELAEMELHKDQTKAQHDQKEELFFAIDEKAMMRISRRKGASSALTIQKPL